MRNKNKNLLQIKFIYIIFAEQQPKVAAETEKNND